MPFHTEPACTALVVNVAVIHDSITGADVMVVHGSGAALIGYTDPNGEFRPLLSKPPVAMHAEEVESTP